jgi:hypothetical protein
MRPKTRVRQGSSRQPRDVICPLHSACNKDRTSSSMGRTHACEGRCDSTKIAGTKQPTGLDQQGVCRNPDLERVSNAEPANHMPPSRRLKSGVTEAGNELGASRVRFRTSDITTDTPFTYFELLTWTVIPDTRRVNHGACAPRNEKSPDSHDPLGYTLHKTGSHSPRATGRSPSNPAVGHE